MAGKKEKAIPTTTKNIDLAKDFELINPASAGFISLLKLEIF